MGAIVLFGAILFALWGLSMLVGGVEEVIHAPEADAKVAAADRDPLWSNVSAEVTAKETRHWTRLGDAAWVPRLGVDEGIEDSSSAGRVYSTVADRGVFEQWERWATDTGWTLHTRNCEGVFGPGFRLDFLKEIGSWPAQLLVWSEPGILHVTIHLPVFGPSQRQDINPYERLPCVLSPREGFLLSIRQGTPQSAGWLDGSDEELLALGNEICTAHRDRLPEPAHIRELEIGKARALSTASIWLCRETSHAR